MDNKCQSVDTIVHDGSNRTESDLRKNDLLLRPVTENESGQGLPYAPIDWPKPGDIWGWKVGGRKTASGDLWQDRYMYLPTRLQKSSQQRKFRSMLAVKRYIQEEFPDADIDVFFSSFSWRIPATDHMCAEGQATISGMNRSQKVTKHSQLELKVEAVDCKAGNWMCRIQLQARNYSLTAMACHICCSETGFCRDCCCILCCKSVDWAYGGYSFIRCEAKVNQNYICGHVAHIDCALRSSMAGTVGGNNNLDVEYYCRRCDKKSDLIMHVIRILQTCESVDARDDIEKILNMGSCILYGSKTELSKKLLHRIELDLAKLKSGNPLEDVWKVEGNNIAISAGKSAHYDSNGALYATMEPAISQNQTDTTTPHRFDDMQETRQSVASNQQIESLKLEEKIERDLQDLSDSQVYEYRIAEEHLCAQKDFVLHLQRQLERKRYKLGKRTSSGTDCNVEALITSIMNKVKEGGQKAE